MKECMPLSYNTALRYYYIDTFTVHYICNMLFLAIMHYTHIANISYITFYFHEYIYAAELFHLEVFKGNYVRIVGYLPPPTKFGQIKWYLTIHEGTHGSLDGYPKFRPENEEVRPVDLSTYMYNHNFHISCGMVGMAGVVS